MPKIHWKAAQTNQWLINILITGPQYESRLAMWHCLNVKYNISGVYRHSLAVMKTCHGAKKQTEGAVTSSLSLAKDFSVSFSVTFGWLMKERLFLLLTWKYSQCSQALLLDNTYGVNTEDQLCTLSTVCVYWPSQIPAKQTQCTVQTPTVHCCCCYCYD